MENTWIINDSPFIQEQFQTPKAETVWGWFGMPFTSSVEFSTPAISWIQDFNIVPSIYGMIADIEIPPPPPPPSSGNIILLRNKLPLHTLGRRMKQL